MTVRTLALCFVTAGLAAACGQPSSTASNAPATPPAAAPAPAPTGPVKPPTTDDEMIKSAMSAAPEAVAKDATIIAMNEKMEMRTLKPGTNGWTCFPDMPSTPGADPMCVDKNGMDWAGAWMSHKDPPKGKIALAYMLAGGSDASNDDPFATKPKEGGQWVDTGPHVMVLNPGKMLDGYPTSAQNTKVPYVMFANTPYAHIMMPVK
jgi:hypothetical protein